MPRARPAVNFLDIGMESGLRPQCPRACDASGCTVHRLCPTAPLRYHSNRLHSGTKRLPRDAATTTHMGKTVINRTVLRVQAVNQEL